MSNPDQFNFVSKYKVFDAHSPSIAPASTKNPFLLPEFAGNNCFIFSLSAMYDGHWVFEYITEYESDLYK